MNLNATEEIKSALARRIDSSVVGTFTITFLIYNWKVFIYAFDGKLAADEKIRSIANSVCWHSYTVAAIVTILMIQYYPDILELTKNPIRKVRLKSELKDIQADSLISLYKELKVEEGANLVQELICLNMYQTKHYVKFFSEISNAINNTLARADLIKQLDHIQRNFDSFYKSTQSNNQVGADIYHITLGLTDELKINNSLSTTRKIFTKIKAIKDRIESLKNKNPWMK